jgi:hypothetical protein
VILADLRAWVIAYAGAAGQGYVGKPVIGFGRLAGADGVLDLETPYVLSSGYVVTPQRQLVRPLMLFPLELLVTAPPLRVHYSALLRLAELDADDFNAVAEPLLVSIEQAEGMRASVRSQRSGVVLAPAGAKLPPMPARG